MTREKKFFVPELHTYNNNINKRWRIEWLVPSNNGKGKRCPNPIYISQAPTVEQRLKEAEQKLKNIRFERPEKPKSLFDKVFDRMGLVWREDTVKTYRTPIVSYEAWLTKKRLKIETVTETQFRDYIASLYGKFDNNTISKYRDTIFTFYGHVKRLKLSACSNPVVKDIRLKTAAQSLMYFSDQQIRRIAEYDMPKQLWTGISLLFYTFIRPKEQRCMRIDWINFDAGFIEIPAQYSKNKKTEKVVIPDALYQDIEHLKQYPGNYFVLSKSGAPGLVQISKKWLNDQMKKVLDALQIRGRYAFYSWKHTGAVKAVKAGINIKDLQLQLRHHSLDMVNEYLKNLGVMDSEDLRTKFPTIHISQVVIIEFAHKKGCTCKAEQHFKYCPECGVKLPTAA